MKKIILLFFTFCFMLVSCNKPIQNEEESKPNPPIEYPTYTNEELRQNLKSKFYEFQSRIKDKQQFKLSGEFNAPDTEFSGMYIYKNVNAIVDAKEGDPFIKLKTDVYLKENNVVNDIPDKRIEFIRKTEGSQLFKNTVDYVLDEYIDEKNKIYTKTIEENAGTIFDIALQTLLAGIKQFEIDDIPNTIKYSYNRDNASYGMEIKFKDLDGTPLNELLNIFLSFVPELNELLLKFKDEIIINICNIKLDTPITTFDIDVNYPAMEGAFDFNILHGSFNLSFKQIIRDDVSKLRINNTYLKARLGRNNISKYIQPYQNDDNTFKYRGGLIVDTLSALDITKIDINNIDILKLIQNRKIKIDAPSSTSIKYYNRFTKEEIIVKNNILELSLLDMVLVEIEYPKNATYYVTISVVDEENNQENNGNQNIEQM